MSSLIQPSRPRLIGLTGGMCCGKSTVEDFLVSLGYPVANTDTLVRIHMSPGGAFYPALTQRLGPDFLDGDGCLIRPRLRERVFFDDDLRHWIEESLDPLLRADFDRLARETTGPVLFVASALIVSPVTGERWDFLDSLLTIEAPRDLQLARMRQRDTMSEALMEQTLRIQATPAQRQLASRWVVVNDSTVQALQAKVRAFLRDAGLYSA